MPTTDNIHSVATFAAWPIYEELVLLLRSLRVFHPKIPVYLLTQSRVAEQLSKDDLMDDNIFVTIGLEQYSTSWKKMSFQEAAIFLAHKTVITEIALAKHSNTLFIDCDVLILAPLPKIDKTKDIGLVRQLIKNYDIHGAGKLNLDTSLLPVVEDKYTSSFLFINNKNFPHQWKKAIYQIKDPQQYTIDQTTLTHLVESFSYFHFSFRDHLFLPLFRDQYKWLLRLRLLRTQPTLSHRNRPIRSIHRHFLNQDRWNSLPIFLLYLLYKSQFQYFDYINNHVDGPHYNPTQLKKGYLFYFTHILKVMTQNRIREDMTRKSIQRGTSQKSIQQDIPKTVIQQGTARNSTLFLLKKKMLGGGYILRSLYYLLRRIYHKFLFSYYLTKEILLLHRIIRKSEFAMSKSKLFIIAFLYNFKLLGRRYYHSSMGKVKEFKK